MSNATPLELQSIHHDGSTRYVHTPDRDALRIGDEVIVRLRAGLSTPLEKVILRTCPDGEQLLTVMEPETVSSGAVCRWWRANLRLEMPVTGYRFLLFLPDTVWWYNGTGLHRNLVTDVHDFRLLAGYQAPSWVSQSVFYQIFPDRFADGNPANNVRPGEYTYWGEPVRVASWGQTPISGHRTASIEFYGGDLAGIIEHLDYLEELGINAVYLNPIFTSLSNHRYDVVDYEQVDPHLGGNQALIDLRAALDRRSMRLVLDIVPNHCGIMHPWFQAALNDPQASTSEFFTFFEHPVQYACWLGVAGLPKLNYRSQALREKMYASPEAIFRRWLQPPYQIDGWRLDVANMLARQGPDQLGHEIGQGIRRAVKSENPEAYILGENFFDGTTQLQGDLWDATMNYAGFNVPLFYWLNGYTFSQHMEPKLLTSGVRMSTQDLAASWQEFRASIPWAIARQQFNLLGSHDTPRVINLLKGDRDLNRLAAGLLMTYPGVPSVYYGDEIALGDGAGATRMCMNWASSAWDRELRRFYQSLIQLRRTSSALRDGGFQVLAVEKDTLIYLRDSEAEQLIVIAHRGPGVLPAYALNIVQGGIPDGVNFKEVFSQQEKAVAGGHLDLDSMSPGIEIWQSRAVI